MSTPVVFALAAFAAFALLAVWLALEPLANRAKPRPLRFLGEAAKGCLVVALKPLTIDPLLIAYSLASGQGREGISKRTVRSSSKRSRYFLGVRRLLRDIGFSAAFGALFKPRMARSFAFAIQGGSPELDVLEGLTDGEKQELKDLGETTTAMRTKLFDRLKEKAVGDVNQEDKAEIERREKELGEQVDKLIGLAEKQESTEMADLKKDLSERLERFEAQMKDMGRRPVGPPKSGSPVTVAKEDAYEGDNLFMDILKSKKGDYEAGRRVSEYAEKFHGPDRLKAWAQGELEENDLILPDVQAALPFLRAQAKATALFRELRTNAPSVTFPVFKTGLKVAIVKHGEKKPESEPEFDLRLAEVFTLAGLSDIPNPLLEDFPAARGWISSELGSATGAAVEIQILTGDGEGEPLGLYTNKEIPTRKPDEVAKASVGRNIITSIFRGSQQIRIIGFMEPTDVLLNPAIWTDVVLSFEENIGFLYGPPQMEGTTQDGPPLNTPPARILGLPVTWSSYVPTDEGKEKDETSVVVGNFMDGVVLRRAPFRIDVDTSVGFKSNLTCFRGEERMGFIVVRPKSFVKVGGFKPSPVE